MKRIPIVVALAVLSLTGCASTSRGLSRNAGAIAVGVAAAAVAAGVNAAASAPRSSTPAAQPRSEEDEERERAEADAKLRAAQERRGDFFHGDDAFP